MMELGQAAGTARFCPVSHPTTAPKAYARRDLQPANEVTPAVRRRFGFRHGPRLSRGAARRQHLAQGEGNLRRKIAFYNARGGTEDVRRANQLKQRLATTQRRRGDLEAARSGQMLVVQPSSALSGVGAAEGGGGFALPKINRKTLIGVAVVGALLWLGKDKL